jgi:hypothetical protein
MPSVFLSYSREDLPRIEEFEAQIQKQTGISIWRDQERLYGGQKWPKLLGEAVAAQDFFLLAWSGHSASSHFVEFEWCTALALKKTLIPCLLDNTPLPPSLTAIHAIPIENITRILTALTAPIPPKDKTRGAGVISGLDQIRAIESEAVLAQAKAIFDQKHWVVHGNVIQGKHVTVTFTEGGKEPSKGFLDKWQTWAGLAVALLTAVSLIADLPGKIKAGTSASAIKNEAGSENQLLEQPLEGSIRYEDDPAEGVTVSLLKFNQTVTTDALGQFRFRVKAPRQETVTLLAQKNGYRAYENDFTLGNTDISFTLKKKP